MSYEVFVSDKLKSLFVCNNLPGQCNRKNDDINAASRQSDSLIGGYLHRRMTIDHV